MKRNDPKSNTPSLSRHRISHEKKVLGVGTDIDKRAIWLAVALGFDSGPRIGNIT